MAHQRSDQLACKRASGRAWEGGHRCAALGRGWDRTIPAQQKHVHHTPTADCPSPLALTTGACLACTPPGLTHDLRVERIQGTTQLGHPRRHRRVLGHRIGGGWPAQQHRAARVVEQAAGHVPNSGQAAHIPAGRAGRMGGHVSGQVGEQEDGGALWCTRPLRAMHRLTWNPQTDLDPHKAVATGMVLLPLSTLVG